MSGGGMDPTPPQSNSVELDDVQMSEADSSKEQAISQPQHHQVTPPDTPPAGDTFSSAANRAAVELEVGGQSQQGEDTEMGVAENGEEVEEGREDGPADENMESEDQSGGSTAVHSRQADDTAVGDIRPAEKEGVTQPGNGEGARPREEHTQSAEEAPVPTLPSAANPEVASQPSASAPQPTQDARPDVAQSVAAMNQAVQSLRGKSTPTSPVNVPISPASLRRTYGDILKQLSLVLEPAPEPEIADHGGPSDMEDIEVDPVPAVSTSAPASPTPEEAQAISASVLSSTTPEEHSDAPAPAAPRNESAAPAPSTASTLTPAPPSPPTMDDVPTKDDGPTTTEPATVTAPLAPSSEPALALETAPAVAPESRTAPMSAPPSASASRRRIVSESPEPEVTDLTTPPLESEVFAIPQSMATASARPVNFDMSNLAPQNTPVQYSSVNMLPSSIPKPVWPALAVINCYLDDAGKNALHNGTLEWRSALEGNMEQVVRHMREDLVNGRKFGGQELVPAQSRPEMESAVRDFRDFCYLHFPSHKAMVQRYLTESPSIPPSDWFGPSNVLSPAHRQQQQLQHEQQQQLLQQQPHLRQQPLSQHQQPAQQSESRQQQQQQQHLHQRLQHQQERHLQQERQQKQQQQHDRQQLVSQQQLQQFVQQQQQQIEQRRSIAPRPSSISGSFGLATRPASAGPQENGRTQASPPVQLPGSASQHHSFAATAGRHPSHRVQPSNSTGSIPQAQTSAPRHIASNSSPSTGPAQYAILHGPGQGALLNSSPLGSGMMQGQVVRINQAGQIIPDHPQGTLLSPPVTGVAGAQGSQGVQPGSAAPRPAFPVSSSEGLTAILQTSQDRLNQASSFLSSAWQEVTRSETDLRAVVMQQDALLTSTTKSLNDSTVNLAAANEKKDAYRERLQEARSARAGLEERLQAAEARAAGAVKEKLQTETTAHRHITQLLGEQSTYQESMNRLVEANKQANDDKEALQLENEALRAKGANIEVEQALETIKALKAEHSTEVEKLRLGHGIEIEQLKEKMANQLRNNNKKMADVQKEKEEQIAQALEKENASKEAAGKNTARIQQLEKSNKQLKEEAKALEAAAKLSAGPSATFQARQREWLKQKEELEASVQELTLAKVGWEDREEKMGARMEKLGKDLAEAERVLENKAREIAEVEKAGAATLEEFEANAARQHEELGKDHQRLQRQLERVQTELDELKAVNDALTLRQAEMQEEAQGNALEKKRAEEQDKRIKDLEARLIEVVQEHEGAMRVEKDKRAEEVKEFEQRLSGLTSSLLDRQATEKEQSKEKRKVEEEKERLEKEVERLQKELKKAARPVISTSSSQSASSTPRVAGPGAGGTATPKTTSSTGAASGSTATSTSSGFGSQSAFTVKTGIKQVSKPVNRPFVSPVVPSGSSGSLSAPRKTTGTPDSSRKRERSPVKPTTKTNEPLFMSSSQSHAGSPVSKKVKMESDVEAAAPSANGSQRASVPAASDTSRAGTPAAPHPKVPHEWIKSHLVLGMQEIRSKDGTVLKVVCKVCHVDEKSALKARLKAEGVAKADFPALVEARLGGLEKQKPMPGVRTRARDEDKIVEHLYLNHQSMLGRLKAAREKEGKGPPDDPDARGELGGGGEKLRGGWTRERGR